MADKNRVVVWCLLATSAIMLSEKNNRKRKMWSEKWYLKRNTSCDAPLFSELLETDVPWDDSIVVSAGKLRKLWDSLSELRSSLCERRLERTFLRPALFPAETAQFTQFFPLGMTSHSKIARFNWECIRRFTLTVEFSVSVWRNFALELLDLRLGYNNVWDGKRKFFSWNDTCQDSPDF